jgi:hypothetical protein
MDLSIIWSELESPKANAEVVYTLCRAKGRIASRLTRGHGEVASSGLAKHRHVGCEGMARSCHKGQANKDCSTTQHFFGDSEKKHRISHLVCNRAATETRQDDGRSPRDLIQTYEGLPPFLLA